VATILLSHYVPITVGIMTPSGAMTTLTLVWQVGVEMPLVVEPLEVVELLGVVMQGHL
jgi:hypothetical protein